MTASEKPLSPREKAILAKYRKRKDWKRKVAERLAAQLAGGYAEERDPLASPPDAGKGSSPDDEPA